MKRLSVIQCGLFAVVLAAGALGQRALDSAGLNDWIAGGVHFVHFDTRGDQNVDSILYPGFYTPEPIVWVDSLRCSFRLLIAGNNSTSADNSARQIVARGYPSDSVFYGSYDELGSPRFSALDTIPLAMLSGATLTQSTLSSSELRGLIVGRQALRLIDVRTELEASTGVIPTACNIPWQEPFKSMSANFDRSVLHVLYCASGNRASLARQYLLDNGFESALVINFGGFSKWTGSSGPAAMGVADSCFCISEPWLASVGKTLGSNDRQSVGWHFSNPHVAGRANGRRFYTLTGRTVAPQLMSGGVTNFKGLLVTDK